MAAVPEYVLYYDTTVDVERCRRGYMLWKENRAGRDDLLWVKDLQDDPAVRSEHPSSPLPILKMVAMPFVGWFGDEAIAKMEELYGISRGVPQAVVMPPSPLQVDPVPLTPRVKARYVLYTNDMKQDIKVPANGIVNVQSFDLVCTTLGDKLPKWLRQYRQLPVLATLEDRPTVWYGQAAKDQCMFLCTFNGGFMLF